MCSRGRPRGQGRPRRLHLCWLVPPPHRFICSGYDNAEISYVYLHANVIANNF